MEQFTSIPFFDFILSFQSASLPSFLCSILSSLLASFSFFLFSFSSLFVSIHSRVENFTFISMFVLFPLLIPSSFYFFFSTFTMLCPFPSYFPPFFPYFLFLPAIHLTLSLLPSRTMPCLLPSFSPLILFSPAVQFTPFSPSVQYLPPIFFSFSSYNSSLPYFPSLL